MDIHRLKGQVGGLIAFIALVAALVVPMTALGLVDKVTICHAAGLEGTDQFVTLELPTQAVYGNGGHFHENGTTRAGHEGDYMGACNEATTPTTESPVTTRAGEEQRQTTAEGPGTTEAGEEDSTTTTSPLNPSEKDVASTVETTSTTAAEEASTTVAGGHEDGPPDTGSTSDSAPAAVAEADTTDERAASDTLPFTGPSMTLVYPASLLVFFGLMAVFVTRGFGSGSGVHTAVAYDRFGLGLHRGKHESTRSWI